MYFVLFLAFKKKDVGKPRHESRPIFREDSELVLGLLAVANLIVMVCFFSGTGFDSFVIIFYYIPLVPFVPSVVAAG